MRIRLSILLLLVSFSLNIFADYPYSRYRLNNMTAHHFGISAGVGYGALWDDFTEITCIGNVGGTLGLEYEMRVNGFWLSVGPEVQLFQGMSLFKTTGTDVKIIDTYGVEAMYHYDFNRCEDYQRMVFVNLPITLGYYCYGFYIGAGAKIGCSVYGEETTNLKYTTTGTYEEYIDDFQQMANHSYGTYSSSASRKLSDMPKIAVIGEIGYDVLAWYRNQDRTITSGLKISICAEYGLNNILGGGTDVSLYNINSANASKIELNPFYSSRAGSAHRIHPFYAGVKLTWLLCIKTKSCNCYDNWQYFNSRYKNMNR